ARRRRRNIVREASSPLASGPGNVGEAIADGVENDERVIARFVLLAPVELFPLPDIDAPRIERIFGVVIAPVDPGIGPAKVFRHERLCAFGCLDRRDPRCVRRTILRAERRAFAIDEDRPGDSTFRRDPYGKHKRTRRAGSHLALRANGAAHEAAPLPGGTSTSRLPLVCIGDTRPARSICSINRAARLYPIRKCRWTSEIDGRRVCRTIDTAWSYMGSDSASPPSTVIVSSPFPLVVVPSRIPSRYCGP